MDDAQILHFLELFPSNPELLTVKAPGPGVDRRTRSFNMVLDLVFDFSFEILLKEGREFC